MLMILLLWLGAPLISISTTNVDFYSKFGMVVNTNKTNIMMIKTKQITYIDSLCVNNNLEKSTSYKYPKVKLHHKFLAKTIELIE